MLHSPADDVTSATAVSRGRHLRRVDLDGCGDTDLSHLPAPPTPVTELPVRPAPEVVEPGADLQADSWRLVNRRSAKHVTAHLSRSESVKRTARGTVARRKGVLVLTTQRLLFVRDRGAGAASVDFHLASVSSITIDRSPTASRIVIHCLGVLTEVYDVPHADAESLVDEAKQILTYIRFPVVALRPRRVPRRPPRRDPASDAAPSTTNTATGPTPAREAAPPAPPMPVATHPSALLVTHLRELSQLHQAGLLDAYEFALAKAKLLT